MTNSNITHNPTYKASLQDKNLLLSSIEDYLFDSRKLEAVVNNYYPAYYYTEQQLNNFIKEHLLDRSIQLIMQQELILSMPVLLVYWFDETFSLQVDNYIALWLKQLLTRQFNHDELKSTDCRAKVIYQQLCRFGSIKLQAWNCTGWTIINAHILQFKVKGHACKNHIRIQYDFNLHSYNVCFGSYNNGVWNNAVTYDDICINQLSDIIDDEVEY